MILPFVLFLNWVNLMLVKMRPVSLAGARYFTDMTCSSANAPLSFFFFFFLVFIYILFNLALVKGAGLTPLEAEALYFPTEQIQHGRQLCKFPHAAPTHVPHLCPGGTTSRGERIVQSP